MTAVESLTETEIKIVELASKGHRIADIADKLYLSPRTVDGHRDKILVKLNATNITHCVGILFRKGILK